MIFERQLRGSLKFSSLLGSRLSATGSTFSKSLYMGAGRLYLEQTADSFDSKLLWLLYCYFRDLILLSICVLNILRYLMSHSNFLLKG